MNGLTEWVQKVATKMKLTTRHTKTKARRTIPETGAIVLQKRKRKMAKKGTEERKNNGKSAEKGRKAEKKEVIKLREGVARPVVSSVHWLRGCTGFATTTSGGGNVRKTRALVCYTW